MCAFLGLSVVVCVNDEFTAHVYGEDLELCASIKGSVTRKGLDVSRRADRCSAEGEAPRLCMLVYVYCVCARPLGHG